MKWFFKYVSKQEEVFKDLRQVFKYGGNKLPCVVPTCPRSGLVHGLSWTGLAIPTTPWLRATVSHLPVMCDTRLWRWHCGL
ncbi:hypothetical protein TIFTF001_032200 [Ficus carica]|uniref:Uncharacterized protein n=1 Tax=Ficus carica TaxID=3494 RepID=A0AA88J6E5_FICCA|nr:hypothetical protein TIFTF001_032200 [Ficus carica]